MLSFVLAALVVLCAAILRGLTGFGFALVAVPLLAFAMPPTEAVVTAVLLQCMTAAWDVVLRPRPVDRRFLVNLLIGAVVGAPAGAFLLIYTSDAVVFLCVGAAVLLGLGGLGLKMRFAPTVFGERLTGALAGVLAGVAGIPGPPVVLYAMATGREGPAVRETFIVFFGAAAFLAVPVLVSGGLITRTTFVQSALLLPLLIGGSVLGRHLGSTVSPANVRYATAMLLAGSALASLWKGGAGL